MKYQSGNSSVDLIAGLGVITLVVAAIVGWVLNIVAIAHVTAFSGMVILRAIGVFVAPLGAVMGWI